MKIAILGGSFDPPHLGHLLVYKQIIDFGNIDEVWLMPCYSHPFLKKMTDPRVRLEMCKVTVKDFGNRRIKVSDLEIRQDKKSYTIETVKTLKQKYPKDQFFWIIGSDNLAGFKKWKNWQKLLKEIKFLVFPRIDHPINPPAAGLPEGFILVKSELLVSTNLSSQIIRERVKRGRSIKGMVMEGVENYIYSNNLYK